MSPAVLTYPETKPSQVGNSPSQSGWTWTRDALPKDSGLYQCAIRHKSGVEEIRRAFFDHLDGTWGVAGERHFDVLAWHEMEAFPSVPWVADQFTDEITETEFFLYSDGAVYSKRKGSVARRNYEAEREPLVKRIFALVGVKA